MGGGFQMWPFLMQSDRKVGLLSAALQKDAFWMWLLSRWVNNPGMVGWWCVYLQNSMVNLPQNEQKMKGSMFINIFLCNLNPCKSSEYFKTIFEELGFITVVCGNLFTRVLPDGHAFSVNTGTAHAHKGNSCYAFCVCARIMSSLCRPKGHQRRIFDQFSANIPTKDVFSDSCPSRWQRRHVDEISVPSVRQKLNKIR